MNFEKLSAYLDTLPAADIKNLVCCVARDHKPIFTGAIGHVDYECSRAARADSIYLLYSATKVITCTAAMRLVGEGRLGIDDPVSKYLPAYKNLTVKHPDGEIRPAEREMTVRHLFGMTCGYGGRRDPSIVTAVEQLLARKPEAITSEIVGAFAETPLEFEPGTHYKYGLGHDILAGVVEVASGERFGNYLQKNIFDPLGMTDFTFRPDVARISRLCAMYSYNTPLNRSTPKECPTFYGYSPNYEAGGAGLYGSPEQYLILADALACGGVAANGYRVLGEEQIAMMRENILDETPLADFRRSPRKFGFGWGLCGRVHMSPEISLAASPKGEFGWDGAAGAYVLIDTENRLSFFCGMHTMECSYAYERIHPHIRDLIYEAIKAD